MAERYDSIPVFNPLTEDFMVRFNGEPYSIREGETKNWPSFLAYHIAKHLSDKMLQPELLRIKEEGANVMYNPKNAQLMVYDNVSRRKALYDILQSKDEVERCLGAFNFKGFIGDMNEYDSYVESKRPKATPNQTEEESSDEEVQVEVRVPTKAKRPSK
jgi:hypothetical protein